ncbi:MAG TPA: N-acyl homoserine lactone synthase [Rhodobacterales bacterium]|nr:N-acyl homoserine lactone synthase [Rhodobacterales bacterium]
MTKRIVIVGGGYVGTQLARGLDDHADVTLIDQKSRFVHAPAMIRAVVDPSLVGQALIPYDKLLKRGRFVEARVESIDGSRVTLSDGTGLEADFIVVATGSDYAAPFKPEGADFAGLRAENARVHGLLTAAETVAIVGAGAVGTELAGEISHAMPDKKITLISSDQSLFPTLPAKLGAKLLAKLRARGVNVILGARAENLANLSAPYAGSLSLSDGQEITADLVFPVIGARAVPALLEGFPGVRKTSSNRVQTDGFMRPSTLPNVFAAGDVADNGDAMTIVAATRQIPWLKKTLLALAGGKTVDDIKPYKPWGKAPILLPLGPVSGNSYLILGTFGDWVTRTMKGKDLFRARYRKDLGQV